MANAISQVCRRFGHLVALSLLIVMGAVAGRTQPAPATSPVTVFAAASLKNALDEVIAAYQAQRPARVRASYGASSALARQIEQGAPADVFISADPDWMDYLAGRRLIAAASRRDLLTNHLALIAPADSQVRLTIGRGMPLAKALDGGRLAVAGPEVPAGRYARTVLERLGALASVQNRLAPAENVRAAMALVARGEAPLGIVYDTDARTEPKVRIVGLFPDGSHAPIVYPIALTAASSKPGASDFLAFAEGPRAAAIFRKYGFRPIGVR